MPEWITDRLPTEADADQIGRVVIGKNLSDYTFLHFSFVGPGQPWYSCRFIPFEPTNKDLFEQAQINHLRAKTDLIRAQARAITWATTFFNNEKDLALKSGIPEFITSIINNHPGSGEAE